MKATEQVKCRGITVAKWEGDAMKTLNEVIKANECCDHGEPDSRCEDCPYNGIGACCLERENDALFYLKEYRFAVENCADALAEKYPSENVPLTWDELNGMEGKPVWIEGPLLTEGPHWIILGATHLYDGKNVGYGKTWRAYRKERR